MRWCTGCSSNKDESEFYASKWTRSGFTYRCKSCKRASSRAYGQSARGKEVDKNARDRAGIEARRDSWLRQKYGISYAEFQELFLRQKERCAVCLLTEQEIKDKGGKQRWGVWHLDHDHATNAVRSILCYWCNMTLGYSKENVFRLKRCLAYLRFHTHKIVLPAGTTWQNAGIPQGGLLRKPLKATA